MPTVAEQILTALASEGPLSDRALAERLGKRPQSVNPVANRLAHEGRTRRLNGPGGSILNVLPEHHLEPFTAPPEGPEGLISEDEVKTGVKDYLESVGYVVTVAWGRTRGVDIEASHGSLPRLIIEAKGEVLSDQQQGSYFLGALGELVQRMDDDTAVYGLALPDNRRYRGLVTRLPALARHRLGLVVYWVTRTSDGTLRVEEDTSA